MKRMSMERAHRLDAPERQLWLPTAEVVGVLALAAGDVVADVGAGTGYFSVPMAEAVGVTGKVYAVDVQGEMLALLRKKLEQRAAANIEPVHAGGEATGLKDGCCDLVFMANDWHEFEDRGAVLREARRILRAPGRIAILDWRPDVEPEHGPPLEHRLSAESAWAELSAAGFEPVTRGNIGSYSWLVQGRLESGEKA